MQLWRLNLRIPKKMKMKKYFLLLLAFAFMALSCDSDDIAELEEIGQEQEQEEQEETVVNSVADFPVQDFMWQIMNIYYFWQQDVPDLADSKFPSLDDPSYAEFLSTGGNPSDFFFNICYQHENVVGEAAAIDRFSRITEDYSTLLQSLQGVSKTNGVEFGLGIIADTDNLFGFVRYILPGSNADGKNIGRGDFFTGVNGTDLTLDNWRDLLFGDADTYVLNLAMVENGIIENTGIEVSLTKEENFVENPILVNTVIEQAGNKIGYLMYNSFNATFDEELNNAFGELKSAGINELILDLRYNGGGRVSSAQQLASSIYASQTGEILAKDRWNNKLQAQFSDDINFTETTIDGSAINNLNLNRLYVITSAATASASEFIINTLDPYIEIVQIGDVTTGKNEFSFTFIDDLDGNIFLSNTSEPNVNPENQFALTPLCGRIENSIGFSDYTAGFIPDHPLREDLTNLGSLGDLQEPLLALTLNIINGTTAKLNFEPIYPIEHFSSSKEFSPLNNMMFMDGMVEPSMSPNNK